MRKVLRIKPGAIKFLATAFARMDGIVGPLVRGIMISLVDVHMVSLETDNCESLWEMITSVYSTLFLLGIVEQKPFEILCGN